MNIQPTRFGAVKVLKFTPQEGNPGHLYRFKMTGADDVNTWLPIAYEAKNTAAGPECLVEVATSNVGLCGVRRPRLQLAMTEDGHSVSVKPEFSEPETRAEVSLLNRILTRMPAAHYNDARRIPVWMLKLNPWVDSWYGLTEDR